ncbi:MAG TPA: type III-B CRISPR module RAMP protein Cmr4 [Chthonomonas sp.]|jgi:CRISPR-associated protein Cmr4|uniref:type III-B CRISPR module RAMP protein Cmr4 n=1 Tax=Chthonomonas sp. TaxID=2282153 RepID=UPI002B4AAFEB|nr:type III-B CRISPR module RAMP protein Cmr4 [Chthonomonas sp.]HLH80185.1 type III-B CRISPR module RAMP protein Cmr4 [Chthonomonas sp.]
MTAWALFLHALTPVHSGTGQAVGVIDLPIAREKATGWPVLPASGVKGVFRDEAAQLVDKSTVDKLFGKANEGKDGDSGVAGPLCFGDQRLLCLAVRSFYGTFAYVTSPLVLSRLKRDLLAAGLDLLPSLGQTLNTNSSALIPTKSEIADKVMQKLYFEDIDIEGKASEDAEKVAQELADILFPEQKSLFTERFAVVPDDIFTFLCETATEVTARVKLQDDTKTVQSGGLWYEEAVPAESVFCGIVMWTGKKDNTQEAEGLLSKITKIQVGGKASVGRGICRVEVKP